MKSRKGYKKLYDESFVLKNIETIYNKCTSDDINNGRTWYENAKSFSIYLSKKYNVTEIQSAGIIAALSPQKSWINNMKITEHFIESNGKASVHTGTQLSKASYILKNSLITEEVYHILGGMKTKNFFYNIYNPDNNKAVTIDRHHLNVCYAEDIKGCTDKQYEFLKENTIIFANQINMIPSMLQATLWVCWKRIKSDFKWQN
jgi:hypothetical protein